MVRFIYTFLLVLIMVTLAAVARADDFITVRVSIKVILNPADGMPPDRVNIARLGAIADGDLNYFSNFWRGYRFALAPIIPIGGPGNPNGPSQWFETNFTDEPGLPDLFFLASTVDPNAYAWDPNAINIYINKGTGDGIAGITGCFESSNPPVSGCVIAIGAGLSEKPSVYLHEIGHYFGLNHTQGLDPQGRHCNACEAGKTGVCHTVPGDDMIADTLPDLHCFGIDDIANNHFGTNFANLSAGQREEVLNVFENIMSYHGAVIGSTRSRLTELQLDRWADFASGYEIGVGGSRSGVVDGRTIFLDPNGSGSGDGSSTNPYDTVPNALAAANPSGGDILLFRPGRYPERVTINRPVTLRATRAGPAIIGLPLPPPGGVTCPPANAPRKTKCCEVLPNGMCRSVTDCIDPTAPTGGCP